MTNEEVYFDNSATTRPYSEVVDAMVQMLTMNYGNPSSLHQKGIDAERAVKRARKSISDALNAQESEIIFTSGGTEANNLAIRGIALTNQKKGKHLITSNIEHPSVLNTFRYLEDLGFRVSYLPVNSQGSILLEAFEKELCEDTILVSIMHVNNEVGTIQPINQIKRIMVDKKSKAFLHVDAIQSFGKLQFTPELLGCNLLSMSAHKLHGPKGVGALYIKKGTNIKSIVFGGGQESGVRSGTENVPGIIGFGKAVELTFKNLNQDISHLKRIKEALQETIKERIQEIVFNSGISEEFAPHILNVSFPGVKSEVLLHTLESKGIFVSTGSACSSNKPSPSHVLTQMGVTKDNIDSALRFSFSKFNTIEQVEYCGEQLQLAVQQLRKYRRR